MTFFDYVRSLFRYKPASQPAPRTHIRAMPGGRASRDTADSMAFASWLVQPPSGYQTNWQMINLDMRAIHRLLLGPPESSDRHRLGDHRLLRILQDLLERNIRSRHNIPERAARLARPGQGHRTLPLPDQPNEDSQHDREHR